MCRPQKRTLKGFTRGSGESSPVTMFAQRPSLRERAAGVGCQAGRQAGRVPRLR